MYQLFDKLKAGDDKNKASLVDISGLMEEVMRKREPPLDTVGLLVAQLRAKMTEEIRRYEETKAFSN